MNDKFVAGLLDLVSHGSVAHFLFFCSFGYRYIVIRIGAMNDKFVAGLLDVVSHGSVAHFLECANESMMSIFLTHNVPLYTVRARVQKNLVL